MRCYELLWVTCDVYIMNCRISQGFGLRNRWLRWSQSCPRQVVSSTEHLQSRNLKGMGRLNSFDTKRFPKNNTNSYNISLHSNSVMNCYCFELVPVLPNFGWMEFANFGQKVWPQICRPKNSQMSLSSALGTSPQHSHATRHHAFVLHGNTGNRSEGRWGMTRVCHVTFFISCLMLFGTAEWICRLLWKRNWRGWRLIFTDECWVLAHVFVMLVLLWLQQNGATSNFQIASRNAASPTVATNDSKSKALAAILGRKLSKATPQQSQAAV